MPNWCDNSITISGPKDKITELWKSAQTAQQGDFGLLEAMVPIGDWEYDTAVENWGTKWDISDEGLELNINGNHAKITGYFQSAWSPPIDAYDNYLDLNPEVEIHATYNEGISFLGKYENGNNTYYEDLKDLVDGGAMQDDKTFARLVGDYDIEEDIENSE